MYRYIGSIICYQSTRACRIISIDGSCALAMAGVHAVLTAEDIPDIMISHRFSRTNQFLPPTPLSMWGIRLPSSWRKPTTWPSQLQRPSGWLTSLGTGPFNSEALANRHYTFPEQIMERGDPDGAIEVALIGYLGEYLAAGKTIFEGRSPLALPSGDNDMLVYSSTASIEESAWCCTCSCRNSRSR